MDDLVRFFERNGNRFAATRESVFVNVPSAALSAMPVTAQTEATWHFQDYGQFLNAEALPGRRFGSFPDVVSGQWHEIVMTLPREKDLLDAWLSWAATVLTPDGTLWLAGENRAGARSAGKWLAEKFGSTTKIDTARHCCLYRAQGPRAGDYFSEQRLMSSWSFEIAGKRYQGESLPGVFAHGRLDHGTRFLLECLSGRPLQGSLLDFGCGSGVIASVLASTHERLEPTLSDSNGLALASARHTLVANGVTGRVVPCDGLHGIDGRYDTIVSNPPFHRSVHTDSGMSMAMLDNVRNFLLPRGQLVVVVNRHLPYRPWMQVLFGHCDTLTQNDQYQILRAENRNP